MLNDERGLRSLRRQWRTFEMLALADRTGILSLLTERPTESTEIAARLGLDPRVTTSLLRHLAASRLLASDGDKFRFAHGTQDVVRAFREMAHEQAEMPGFERLLRTGQPLNETVSGVALDDADDRCRFLEGLHRRAGGAVPFGVACVGQTLQSGQGRILDLGGGHGAFAAGFAAAFPEASVTLFDQVIVESDARRLSGSSFEFRGGDFHRDDLGGPYAVAWISNVISCEADAGALHLLRRVHTRLVPRGTAIIRDRCHQDGLPYAIEMTDFGLILAAGTPHGRVRRVSDVMRLVAAAGFSSATVAPADEDYTVVIARH
jgi:hypothetical protein